MLSSIEGGDAFGVRGWVNDGSGSEIAIGETVVYHFTTTRDAYLTVLHMDAHGVVNVLVPSSVWGELRIRPGQTASLPGPGDPQIQAQPPAGVERLYVYATAKPVSAKALGVRLDRFDAIDAQDAPALVRRLARSVGDLGRDGLSVTEVDQRITGHRNGPQYRSADIVSHFERTRGLQRRRLDLHVRFPSASSKLTAEAQRDLDEVAQALNEDRLAERRFTLAGHTDDVGPEDYNMKLSSRRAESVRTYLVKKGIESSRLKTDAFGETRPLESEANAKARAMNRRVELEMLR